MSTRAERTIIDILEEAEPRVLGAAELRELRAALYSRFDLGAELAGGEDVVSARPFPDSLIYNPHLRVHQREADTVLYLFRLDRAVALDDGWLRCSIRSGARCERPHFSASPRRGSVSGSNSWSRASF